MKDVSNNDQEEKSSLLPPSLPNNSVAEVALLSALIKDNDSFEDVADFLKPEHFFEKIYGRVYETICNLLNKGSIADFISLKGRFESDPALKEAGGEKLLESIASSYVGKHNNVHYAEEIRNLSILRQVIAITEEYKERAFNLPAKDEAIDLLEDLEQSCFDIGASDARNTSVITYSEGLHKVLESIESARRGEKRSMSVTTGLIDLDHFLGGGFYPSDLVIIAGRPSMGKTAISMDIAFNAATSGRPVAFFSLEMSVDQIIMRFLSQKSRVFFADIKKGDGISDEDFQKFMEIKRAFDELPLHFPPSSNLTVSSIATKVRQLKRKQRIELVVIDYISLIQSSDKKGKRYENRVQEVSEIARGLKSLAKRLNIPIVALSQLSRGTEQREDKRPQLSDLRESGEIEQVADIVAFVFREEYYESRKKPLENTDKYQEWKENMDKIENVAELIVAKNRNGSVGTIKLYFDTKFASFGNLHQRHDENIDKHQEKKTSNYFNNIKKRGRRN